MTKYSISGTKLRRMRQKLGLTQVEMARRLDVSTSYLNLIEHAQRPLTPKLLARIAALFGIGLDALSDEGESRLAVDLSEVFLDPLLSSHKVDPAEIVALVRTSPSIGRAIADLYRSHRGQRERLLELGTALKQRENPPTLDKDIRSIAAAIRSSAEILADYPELSAPQRRRFLDIILDASKRLVPLVAGWLDDAPLESAAFMPVELLDPVEEVHDFLQSKSGYSEALEQVGERLRKLAGIDATASFERLAQCLRRQHRIEVAVVSAHARQAPVIHESGGQVVYLSEALPLTIRTRELATRLATENARDTIERCLDDAVWSSPEARSLAFSALADYVAGAVLMPYDSFAAAARSLRCDVELLKTRYAVGFEQICRRLTTLRRPGMEGVPFYAVKVDMAGNVIWRFSASGMRIPRYRGVCPLWNVHAAFLSPGIVRPQASRMPDGTSYFSIARTVPDEGAASARSPRLSAIELGCESSFVGDIVYADGFDLGVASAQVPIGSSCQVCERHDCQQRILPPFRRRDTMSHASDVVDA